MKRAFAACARANVPVLFTGEPGIGKTAVIEQLATAWGRHLETVIGSVREATDFLGLPIESGGTVRYAPLDWATNLQQSEAGLLYLGELSTSAPSVQKAMLRIIQERVVGDFQLGQHVAIVSDRNPTESAVDGFDLAPPVANRFIHLDWQFEADTWHQGLLTGFDQLPSPGIDRGLVKDPKAQYARVAAQVSAFLKANPVLLNPGPPKSGNHVDPVKASGPWSSPRSWHNLVQALAHLHTDDEDARDLLVRGAVGDKAAIEFTAWVANNDLIDPEQAMADPNSVPWGARPDQLFVLVHSVSGLALSTDTRKSWHAALDVMVAAAEHNRPDVALPALQSLLGSRHVADGVPQPVRDAFGDILTRVGLVTAA